MSLGCHLFFTTKFVVCLLIGPGIVDRVMPTCFLKRHLCVNSSERVLLLSPLLYVGCTPRAGCLSRSQTVHIRVDCARGDSDRALFPKSFCFVDVVPHSRTVYIRGICTHCLPGGCLCSRAFGRENFRRALQIREKALGSDHPDTQFSRELAEGKDGGLVEPEA